MRLLFSVLGSHSRSQSPLVQESSVPPRSRVVIARLSSQTLSQLGLVTTRVSLCVSIKQSKGMQVIKAKCHEIRYQGSQYIDTLLLISSKTDEMVTNRCWFAGWLRLWSSLMPNDIGANLTKKAMVFFFTSYFIVEGVK